MGHIPFKTLVDGAVLFLVMLLTILQVQNTTAFTHSNMKTLKAHTALMAGRGWENDSFLDNLGGKKDDAEREREERDKYEKFRAQKAKMDEMRRKQEEFFKTEQGQRFLLSRQNQTNDDIDFESQDGIMMGQGIDDDNIVLGSGGGSRFHAMMKRAERGNTLKNALQQPDFDLYDFEDE